MSTGWLRRSVRIFSGAVVALPLILGFCGCPVSTTGAPQAFFSADLTTGPAPLVVHFTDLSKPGTTAITKWSWLFGDGGVSTAQNPVHGYAEAGTYNVSLTVTNAKGEDTKLALNLITVTPGEAEEGKDQTFTLPGSVALDMIWIPAGAFTMGSPDTENDRQADEGPQHDVTLTKGFWMGKYPVTKAQWSSLMGTKPWSGETYASALANTPAMSITWSNAQAFVAELNAYTGRSFHLPTEAQWEYACRAGTSTRYYWANDLDYSLIGNYAWWYGNTVYKSENYAHLVGAKKPNAWGLYDMSGNVWQWCQDWYGSYTADAVNDPTGPASGANHVRRGGSWYDDAPECRSAARGYRPSIALYGLGFRLAK
jgi:formylglycine-generating enzyme required for sulfatase activity